MNISCPSLTQFFLLLLPPPLKSEIGEMVEKLNGLRNWTGVCWRDASAAHAFKQRRRLIITCTAESTGLQRCQQDISPQGRNCERVPISLISPIAKWGNHGRVPSSPISLIFGRFGSPSSPVPRRWRPWRNWSWRQWCAKPGGGFTGGGFVETPKRSGFKGSIIIWMNRAITDRWNLNDDG